MADAKISELTELLTQPNESDLLVIVDNKAVPPTTKKIAYERLVPETNFVSASLFSNQTTSATANSYLTLDWVDYLNNEGLRIDRPSASRFRALVAGYYRMHFEINGFSDSNDRSANLRIIKNGVATALQGGEIRMAHARDNADNPGFSSKTFEVSLAVNDFIQVQGAPLTNDAYTFMSISTIAFEFVREIS